MCMVSNIGDGWKDQFPQKFPQFVPIPDNVDHFARNEIEALKSEMIELKKLLKAAQKFDEATGQPECEVEDKVRLIKEIAKLVGVDLGDVFDKNPKPKK